MRDLLLLASYGIHFVFVLAQTDLEMGTQKLKCIIENQSCSEKLERDRFFDDVLFLTRMMTGYMVHIVLRDLNTTSSNASFN